MALGETFTQTAVSLRAVAQRFSLGLLVLAAIGAMLIGKADTIRIERVRAAVADLVRPVLDAVAKPVAVVNDFVAQLEDVATLRAENARLREENARLLAWQGVARRLDAANAELRGLAN